MPRARRPAGRAGCSSTKRSGCERVERDVDPPEPGRGEAGRHGCERGAVGGERQVDGQRGQLRDQHREVGPHGGLAAGEPDRVDAVALDEEPGDPLDLLEGEHLVPRQPLHPLLGHAVGAAEVAAVGDRDPQVRVHAPEGVDQRSGHRGVEHGGHRPPRLRRSRSDRRRGGGRRTGRRPPRRRRRRAGSRAWARAMAVRWCEPWPPAERTWSTPSPSRSATHPDEVDLAVGPPAERPRRRSPAPPGDRLGVAGHPAQGRAGQQLEAHHRRHGVAGEPEHRRAVDEPEGERLGRADGDLHPAHVADAVEHDLHEVDVAHRHAAAGEHGVAVDGALLDGRR